MKGQSIGYIRVSSLGQNEGRQLEGLLLDKVYTDKLSGSTKDRPQLQACIEYAREGDTIYIHSIDRLARNLRDLQDILETVTGKGVTVTFVKESMTFNNKDDTPISKLLLHVIGAVAEFERVMIRERQREGIELTKLKGTKTGKPFGKQPIDYRLSDSVKRMLSEGLTVSEIARSINLSRSSVYKLQRHPKQSLNM